MLLCKILSYILIRLSPALVLLLGDLNCFVMHKQSLFHFLETV